MRKVVLYAEELSRMSRSYVQVMLAKLLFVRFVPLEIFVERVTSVSCSV